MNPSTSISALLIALLAAGSYWAGDHNRNNAWLAKQSDQREAARKQLEAEQARGDALTTGLINQQNKINQLTQESQDAIKTATTGRACLGSAAIRVLNAAPGMSTKLTSTSGAVAANGPIAAPADDAGSAAPDNGDEFATDTQIGSWAIDAAAQYETCRTRLDKLIDWHTAP
jgi:prophage endopeptidase